MMFLKRLKLGPKLLLTALLLMLPLVVTLGVLLSQWQAEISMGQRYLDGVELERAIRAVLPGMTGHRSASVLLSLGESSAAAKLADDAKTVETGLAQLAAADGRFGRKFGTGERVAKIRARWTELKAAAGLTTAETLAAHDELVRALIDLASVVGENGRFAVDSDNRTVFLLAVLDGALLETANDMSRVRLRASTIAHAGHLDEAGRDELVALIAANEERDLQLLANLRHAAASEDPELAPLSAAGQSYQNTAADFRTLVREKILHGPLTATLGADVSTRYLSAKKAEYALYDSTANTVVTLLKQRVHAGYRHIFTALASILAITLGALAVGFFVRRTLVRQLALARQAFRRMEDGDFSTELRAESHDEAGEVVEALARMQSGLKERIDSEHRIAEENARIRTALDKVSTAAVLADRGGVIIYRNDAAAALFSAIAADVRRVVPSFDAAHLVGMRLNDLTRVPPAQSGIQTSEQSFGAATLRIVVNPVTDATGNSSGTVVQWLDRTAEIATEREVEQIVARALEGDLTHRINETGKTGFFQVLSVGVNHLIDNMAETVRAISAAAQEVRVDSQEIARGNSHLSQRTEEQAASLEETASSMEEMTSTVRSNASNAALADELARAARTKAERGSEVMHSAVDAMTGISAASTRIADIISVIDAIAFQTNLLALNAAVEAARAGDQGRGFAVVAAEVRNLAGRSAEAAREVKRLINDSVSRVVEGSRLVDESGAVLNEIVAAVQKVTGIVAEIANASKEQAAGIEEVNRAIVSMDEVTQQNAALVEEAAAGAEALTQQAASLTALIQRFRLNDAPPARVENEASPDRNATHRQQPERRKASRPWSAPGARAAKAEPATSRAGAAGTLRHGAEDWSEF